MKRLSSFKVKGKRTYAIVAAWLVYTILKSKGIIVPAEVLGATADILVDAIFGLAAIYFRWKANKK